ncbi:hypothetical protein A8F94_07575 [Bacillus sp. FJAT-27225]|uniref:lipopolysaccharide biosynthesis protein n=1 Tax=Bacillus sp. FJAT-27225 TaxID=1743144 RepID=UPI00080C23EC|nr:hypothetical protein [Bacillus sp. FJAT-27225]OCA87704.1 hypothetical protein A8F94_07575 [Bacillus sp. FJAT-27225]
MRTKMAFYTLITNLAHQLVYALIGLILPRLFITVYGSAINGLMLSIRQFLIFLNIVEAGIGRAAITSLLKPIAANDKNATNGILSAVRLLYIRTGYIFASLVVILAIIYPFLIHGQVSYHTSFFLTLLLGLSGFVDFFIIGKYKVLLIADQRGYVYNTILIISLLIHAISSVILIKLGWPILLVNGIATFLAASRALLMILYAKKNYSHVSYNVTPNTNGIAQRRDVLFHQLATLVGYNAPVIIITAFLGLKEVSVFTTYNMVFSAVTMLVVSFSDALFAGIGDLLVRGEKQRVIDVFNTFEFVYYAIISWAYTTALVLIVPFISIYTAGVSDAEYIRPSLAILLVISGVVTNCRMPSSTLVNSAGHYKETRNRAIAEAIINVAASLTFVHIWGVEGVVIGSICAYTYRTIDLIIYGSRKILDASIKPTLYKLLTNSGLAIIAFISIQWIFTIDPKNLYEWFGYAFIISLWNIGIIVLGNFIVHPKMFKGVYLRGRLILAREKGL